jgi:hypothetical protein
MAKAHERWTVLSHGPIEKLEGNLWRVEGALPGMPLKRVMTLARLNDGSVVVHNPIALDEPAMNEIEAWGTPRFVIVPNGWHRLDANSYAERYPNAAVFAPSGGQKDVEQVTRVSGNAQDFPQNDEVSLMNMEGTRERELVLRVKTNGHSTLVFADAVFNMPHLQGLQGFILRHLTQSSGGPRISRVARMMLIKDRAPFADHLQRLATADVKRIIVAHHEPITQEPAGTLRRLADSLR